MLNTGDRIFLKGYYGEVEVTGVDEHLTEMIGTVHYTGIDVSYLEGKSKVNNCEPFTESETRQPYEYEEE